MPKVPMKTDFSRKREKRRWIFRKAVHHGQEATPSASHEKRVNNAAAATGGGGSRGSSIGDKAVGGRQIWAAAAARWAQQRLAGGGRGKRERERSGVDFFPSRVPTVVMPVGSQVLEFDLKGLSIFNKIWSLSTSGQIASTCRFFRAGKFFIGGFPCLEISFSFPLLTAHKTQTLVDEQYRIPNAISF
ncbi:hypothetical protein Dimus_019053 [Dionaea muscipula]